MAYIKTFVESHNDQVGLDPGELDRLHPIAYDGEFAAPLDGARTGPGLDKNLQFSSGYFYADQPETTIFVRKKQWRGEEWLYSVHTDIERQGKAAQLGVRALLANIITRKIEWMGMMEHFTKLQDALQSLTLFGSREASDEPEGVPIGDINDILASEFGLLTDAPLVSDRIPVTRFYMDQAKQFNGIIELGNVSNVSSNISISGGGTASITMENPGNIFYISAEDIELALGERQIEGALTIRKATEDANEVVVSDVGGLTYFRGRWYSKDIIYKLFGDRGVNFDARIVDARDTVDRKEGDQNKTIQAGEDEDTASETGQDASDEDTTKELMRKYFLGKYVFEVMDHIWIWMTSPSKSLFTIPLKDQAEDGIPKTVTVIESPDRGPVADLNYLKAKVARGDTDDEGKDKERIAKLEKEIGNLPENEREQNTVGSALEFDAYKKSLDHNIPVDGLFPGLQEQQYQVFEGVITGVSETFSNGKYQLQLSCKDVMQFLELSRVMIKPSLRGTAEEAPKGFLNNPVWRKRDFPHDDQSPLIGQWKSGSYAANDQFLFGNTAKTVQLNQDLFEIEGVAKQTPVSVDEGSADYGVYLSTQPFAGVDAANVISFLVTGIPYNFETFMNSSLDFGRLFVTNPTSGGSSEAGKIEEEGYFAILKRQISGEGDAKGQNSHLGDFQPYIVVSGINSRTELETRKEALEGASDTLTSAIATLKSELEAVQGADNKFLNEQNIENVLLHAEGPGKVAELVGFVAAGEAQREGLRGLPNEKDNPDLAAAIKAVDQAARVKFEGERAKVELEAMDKASRTFEDGEWRKAIADNPLESRRAHIVAGTDRNLLVVDSAYNKNLAIEAFNRVLADSSSAFNLWQSEYDTPLTVCKKAAESVDFEFFASSQGHLMFRPPTYNRVLKAHLIEFATLDRSIRSIIYSRYGGTAGEEFEDAVRSYSQIDRAYSDGIASIEQLLRGPEQLRVRVQSDPAKFVHDPELNKITGNTKPAQVATILAVVEENLAKELKERKEKGDEENSIIDFQANRLYSNTNELFKKRAELIDVVTEKDTKLNELFVDNQGRPTTDAALVVDENRIHIISDGDIISSSFNEQAPKFTRLDIQGQPDLVNLAEAGETYYWAGGVDYDLWRTYGFLQETRTKPQFHSGPACLPYCQALLGRQWGQIFTGSLTLRGDSKFRLGDCVFIESRDMYYYIEGIQHALTYGSSYTTTLTLTYGRRRGWYIPHPFDALGDLMTQAWKNFYDRKHGELSFEQRVAQLAEERKAAADRIAAEEKEQAAGRVSSESIDNTVHIVSFLPAQLTSERFFGGDHKAYVDALKEGKWVVACYSVSSFQKYIEVDTTASDAEFSQETFSNRMNAEHTGKKFINDQDDLDAYIKLRVDCKIAIQEALERTPNEGTGGASDFNLLG